MTELGVAIGESIGVRVQPKPAAAVHGGSINECLRWESDAGPMFVKVASAASRGMFEAEAAGLEELRRAWRRYCEVIAELDETTAQFEALRRV